MLEIAFPDFVHLAFLRDRLDSAVAEREITRAEGDAFVAALEARHRDGTFFANVFGYNVAGTRTQGNAASPAAPDDTARSMHSITGK